MEGEAIYVRTEEIRCEYFQALENNMSQELCDRLKEET